MEYYSAIRRNVVLIHAMTWKNLKIIMLSERNQTKKKVQSTFILIKSQEMHCKTDRRQINSCLGRWVGRPTEGHRKLLRARDMFIILIVVMVSLEYP